MVQADDFGMCHAVNKGIARAFVDGILTQATMMVPCAWFPEAAALAARLAIPVGLHCTLTSEWEPMRWRPLTSGASLVRADGTFHASVHEAASRVRDDEATAELDAQAQAMLARGLLPIYFDVHMGLVSREAVQRLCERHRRPFILPVVPHFLGLDSMLVLSPYGEDEKRRRLLDYLDGLAPGRHLIQSHPAVAGDELRALAPPDSPDACWAEPYRLSDLALLTDAEVIGRVERRGIELVAVPDLDDEEMTRWPAPARPSRGSARDAATALEEESTA